MAINTDFSLQVEDPTGSNNWIHYPDGISRLTGESANFRIYYSFSATEGGTFNDMSFDVTFPDEYNNLRDVSGVGLPAGASYTMDRTETELRMNIRLVSSLQPGQTAFIEFFVNSNAPQGPNGYLIPPTLDLTGSFRSSTGTVIPIEETDPGPTWTVECALCDTLTKRVVNNGTIYVEDAEAYIVDYRVERRLDPPLQGTYNGVWAAEKCTLTEYLPTITGVTPEIVWSDRQYTVDGNTVVWNFTPVLTPSNGVIINFRLRYPKDQVDLQGGPAAIGDIIDNVTADYLLLHDVPASLSASVTHPLLPLPEPEPGRSLLSKWSDPTSISGTMLGLQNIRCMFILMASAQTGNVIPRTIELTDLQLSIELNDGTTYVPEPDEIEWNSIQINHSVVYFEYQTALGGGVWTHDPSIIGNAHRPFPAVSTGDYITSFRFRGSGFIHPSDNINAYVYLTVKRRDPALEHYKRIINDMTATITMSNGAVLTGTAQAVVPVNYSQIIVTEIVSTAVDDLTINPGGTANVRATLRIASGTTMTVTGTDMFVVIPPGFDLTTVRDNGVPLNPLEYTVTQNWHAMGQSLLRVPIKYNELSKAGDPFYYSLECDVDPFILPGAHNFDFWYVINSEQANNAEITHYAIGTTAPDIYDFDQDGDKEERVAMQTLQVTVTSAHVVNVVKLSKGPRDADFDPDNDTRITAGEMFQYRHSVRNDSPDPITNLVMIDIFPYLGDDFGSQWRPILNAPIIPPPGADIKYSLSDDPSMVPIGPGGTGAWLDNPPADISTVRSIRIDFGSRVFQPGESATLTNDMLGPVGTPLEKTCFNSIRYIASAIIGGSLVPYLPAYSPPAYARVTMTQGTNTIGDYVWSDLNGNGIQDPGEPGLNGIIVELYDGNGTLLQTTLSADHPVVGTTGYYLFAGIMDGTYCVKFDPEPLNGNLLTIQHAGSDPDLDSDPDPVTGYTDLINVAGGENRTDIDAGYLLSCDDELCQAITDLIESVALEQAAVSHILNAEGEKLQAFLELPDQTCESLLEINDSVQKMVDSIALLEMVLHNKIGLTQHQ